MGVVYVAYDQRLERRVAVKRMLAGKGDPRRRERLRREARTTAQLAHPAIVQVFDLIEDEDNDWIVMELVEGTPLARLLVNGPLDIDLILKYGLHIAEGLAAAHHLGIVHRDLKTENVMILPDNRVKILDFGLAKRFDFLADKGSDKALSQPGEVMGTGRAMSPEQARGLEVGPRSDLFSFGVLLYEMLTGVSPFRAESLGDTLKRVATHQPKLVAELVDGVPRALAELVDRLLRKAPELRPASAREVADELDQLAEARRFQAQELSGNLLNTEGTVTQTATAFVLVPEPDSVSGIHSGQFQAGASRVGRLHVGGLSARALSFVASLFILAAIALVIAVYMTRAETPARDAVGATHQVNDNPLELYEEGMRAVRRNQQSANIDRAVDIFSRLIERDSDSAAAHAGLARAYWEKARSGGDPVFLEQASTMAQEAVRLDAYLADAQVSLGLVRLSQGRHDEARGQLETALELDPTNADAHFGLAKMAEFLGRPREAESHYQQAIELRPEPIYHDAIGSLVYDSGRYDEAEEAFLASLSLAPNNVYALRNLSAIYYAQGRMDEAAAKLQLALKIGPNASLYSNLGTIFFSRGLYSKAVAAFEDALRMEGTSYQYIFWLNLADAYRQVPDKEEAARTSYQRAILLLDTAVEAAPGDVRLLSRRALARARAGDLAEALGDIAQIRELGTGNDLYSRFRLAVAEELCGEREKALASLEEALRSGFSLSEVRHEPDLLKLRAAPRFHRLLVALEEASLP